MQTGTAGRGRGEETGERGKGEERRDKKSGANKLLTNATNERESCAMDEGNTNEGINTREEKTRSRRKVMPHG
jgi:hypothetical protein